MANPEHLEILNQGVEVWNEWMEHHLVSTPDLRGADLRNRDLIEVNFGGVDLGGADLFGADLKWANLINAHFIRAKLDGAILTGAKLHRANLAHAELNTANLMHAELTNARLHYSSLCGALLCKANFSSAILEGAKLRFANLEDATLDGADLNHADLTGSNLKGANLGGTKLNFTNLCGTVLGGTIFDSALFKGTILTDADLTQARGLHLAKHDGPSSIGIDTLYRSKGQIPEVFLRGCGVPDSFIAQAKALIGAVEGIQFYSCFISYSGKDDEFARRLHERLQREHVRVWFAPHDMQSGRKLHEQIDEAIKVYEKLLILLSPSSILSDWVMTELRKARKAERKTGRRKLFPIGLVDYTTLQEWECFDADGGQDLAVEVRQYFIPDFTNWKDHDAFEAAFAKLLKDLRASEHAADSAR